MSLSAHFKIFKEWKKQIKEKLLPIDARLPWITIVAKNYIEEYLSKKSKADVKVFEYGSGGSSLFFLKYAAEVHSVEHDEQWFELVKNTIADNKIEGWHGYFRKGEIISKEIVASLDAGEPKDYFTKAGDLEFRNYVTTIDEFADNYFDIVLVDGRSRPSCLSHSFSKVKKGGVLILDNAERTYYNAINLVPKDKFDLVLHINGALICYDQFTQTNIYIKK